MARLILLLMWLLAAVTAEARADQLEIVKSRGKILIGIRDESAPFSSTGPSGERVGFEVELARKIARGLLVEPELVVIGGAEHAKRLEDGSIDLSIVATPDTSENRQKFNLVEPSYYAGGVQLMAPGDFAPISWTELRGKSICMLDGQPFNQGLGLKFGLDRVIVPDKAAARQALATKRCDGWALDDQVELAMVGKDELAGYHLPLEPTLVLSWSVATRLGKDTRELVRAVGDLLAEWHRDGTLQAMERDWNITPHPFLTQQQELWSRQNSKGRIYCFRRDDGLWRPKCRNQLGQPGDEIVATGSVDHLDVIRDRGTLLVGVKSDYVPFGSYGPDGNLEGFDVDLARMVAKELDVEVRLVGVNSANRLQRLEEGAIDIVIATMADTERRRQIATIIEPSYYASGVNLITPKSFQPTDWSELRGRPICVTQGAYFNVTLAQRYLLDLQVFGNFRDAKLALADRRCVGWAYDEPGLVPVLAEPAFASFHMPLKPILVVPWGMAVRKSADQTNFARLVGDLVAQWHRDGTLVDLERRWSLPASDFLLRQRELWSRTNDNGDLYCTRSADGNWRPNCRNQAYITASQTSGLTALGLKVKEVTGLDFTVVYDEFERWQFLGGLAVTLALVVATVAGSVLFGLFAAMIVEARIPVVSRLLAMFATFARMTPPLLQLYVVFFGFGSMMVAGVGWSPGAFAAAAACLSLYAGASNLFAFRDAAETLRHGRDAGAYADRRFGPGMIGPVFRLAYPAVMSNSVNIIKATGLASAIAVPEIISASTAILAERGNAFVMMNLLMVVYFMIVYAAVKLLASVERRLGARHVGR